MKLLPAARGSQEAGLTQPLIETFALPSTLDQLMSSCIERVPSTLRYKIIIDYVWKYPWLIIMQSCSTGDNDNK